MRTVRIDFTAAVLFPDGNYVGRIGEHNATQLAITLPSDMVDGVDYHVACFDVGGTPVSSSSITTAEGQSYRSGNVLYIMLWQALTASTALSLTVEAYAVDGETVTMIAKTPRVTFTLSESVPEVDPESTEAQGMAAQVAALAEKVDDLDETVSSEPLSELGDDGDGNLTYKGKTLVGGDFDISTKADKVTGATADNFAALDANGNMKDSGKKPADFVAAVAGKGLSTEDYTTDEKNKLSGIAPGAEVNAINGVSYNGNPLLATVGSKILNIYTDYINDVTDFIGAETDGVLLLVEYADMVVSLTLDDDVVIELPTAQEMVTGYSHMIYMQLTCSADVNISFAAGVDVASDVDTTTGRHELIMTYYTDGDVWRVRQVAEDFA